MSYASQRTRLVSEKWIRTAAFVLSLMVVAGFAFLSPLPSIAAPADPVRSFDVQLRRGADGRVLAEVSVAGADGETVMNARSIVAAGRPVRLSSAYGSITYQVDVSLNADGGGVATLEVLDASNVIYRSSRALMAHADAVIAETRPITLNLKDADLHDVLRTFSQLSGMRIDADPSLQGKITVEMTDVPWYLALKQMLAPLGLTVARDGDGLRVIRGTASVAGPDGYLRMGDGITAPQVLARVEPIFPAEARAARVAGIVILETRIDETGVVRDVKIVKNMPFGLGDAAADAVRQWVFAPAIRDGRPVPVVFNVTVNFRRDDAIAAAPPR